MSDIYCAFVITTVCHARHTPLPSETIGLAYQEAFQTILTQREVYFDQACIGQYSDGLIQGKPNLISIRDYTDRYTLNRIHGQDGAPAFDQGLKDAPEDLMANNASTTDNLVQLMLETPKAYEQEPLPTMVVAPDRVVTANQQTVQDVFGETIYETDRPTVARYLDDDPGYAQYLAAEPMRQLAEAQFRCEFFRVLAKYPGRVIVQIELRAD